MPTVTPVSFGIRSDTEIWVPVGVSEPRLNGGEDVARRRLKYQLAALIIAERRHASPSVCLRWLPVGLPEIRYLR
jgi:hypothetical protein